MQQLTIAHCPQPEIESLSDLLECYDAVSVTMTDEFDDPILEPEPGTVPLWPHVVIQALFDTEVDITVITDAVTTHFPNTTCSVETIVEQDWERVCLDQFQPQCFGNHLWICPSWHTPPDPNATNLILDPGLAFGTGSHATTALCLTWLAQADLNAKTVIDYGCGSGILGIAALKLGAEHVYAVDIDEQALTATYQNAITNHIPIDTLTFGQPNILTQPVDLLIANILLTPLITLQQIFYNLLKPKGLLVVSGILANQILSLQDAYHDHFNCIHTEREGDWALLVFTKIERYFS